MIRLISLAVFVAALFVVCPIAYTSFAQGGWAFSDFLNKKGGDEITSFDCHPKARYNVQTRAAGSDKWPSL